MRDIIAPVALITNDKTMKEYLAYIRVSTTRQGELGVSLQEQKRASLDYATRRGMAITEWHAEQVSAAGRGRPVFNLLMNQLKSRNAAGIIIHKIDRGARNLRDWADMADLMDSGVEVHFAHASIGLLTRSGRLSADIMAVVGGRPWRCALTRFITSWSIAIRPASLIYCVLKLGGLCPPIGKFKIVGKPSWCCGSPQGAFPSASWKDHWGIGRPSIRSREHE